ncbi:MAG: metallophosphoesterase, partial [Rhodospirillaceae bacterium]
MATYAIGDVHGAHGSLTQLVDRLEFDIGTDSLWFVGDLVNRGPDSLATLRFARSLCDSAFSLLGILYLSLLAHSLQPDAEERLNPTLQPILAAPDREPLLEWLRH